MGRKLNLQKGFERLTLIASIIAGFVGVYKSLPISSSLSAVEKSSEILLFFTIYFTAVWLFYLLVKCVVISFVVKGFKARRTS